MTMSDSEDGLEDFFALLLLLVESLFYLEFALIDSLGVRIISVCLRLDFSAL